MRLLLSFLFVFLFVSATTFAADVEVVEDVTLEADSTPYTIKAPGRLDSFVVNASSFDFTLAPLQWVEIVSSDRRSFTVSPSVATSFVCSATQSTLKIKRHENESQVTVTVTPSSSSCAIAGGGGIGGGGGIITQAPTPTPPSQPISTPVPSPAVAAAAFAIDLEVGMQHEDVKRLQELLRQDPALYPEGLVTGYFGSLTKAAVRRFQQKYGLPPVGRVGSLTRAKLNEIFGKEKPPAPVTVPPMPQFPSQVKKLSPLGITRPLKFGAFHEEVSILQALLAQDKEIYPEGLVTGYFGLLTRTAVQRFQQKYGIVSTGDEDSTGFGLVGPLTRLKLQEVFGR